MLLQLAVYMFYCLSMSLNQSDFRKKVSIIVPVHNDEKFIQKTIQSILDQTYQNFEVLVIDDCSSDNSVELIKHFNDHRIKLFTQSKNMGAAAARNLGLREATGDYVAFLDGDDYWLPKKLETQLDFMRRNNCSFCCSQYYVVSQDDEKLYLMDAPRIIGKQRMKNCCYIGCLTAIYDRRAVGLIQIDERLRKRNDYAIWLSAIQNVGFCLSIPEPLACYRINKRGISHNKSSLFVWHYRLFRWQMRYNPPSSLYWSFVNCACSLIKKIKYRRSFK